ncbi:MAG: hypothetical protein GC136_06315 [Alphaproteobacteria bacterium]|nr:hypothetical protein [Alphaproteobacteria bacterium]
MTREDLLLASTFGVFEVKYKVRANAESEWQERCYTIAHMAGMALTDAPYGAELLALAVRQENWGKFSTEWEGAADYILQNTVAVIDLTEVKDSFMQSKLGQYKRKKRHEQLEFIAPRGQVFEGLGPSDRNEIHVSSLSTLISYNTQIHTDAHRIGHSLKQTYTVAGENEECSTIIFPGYVQAEKSKILHCHDAEEAGYFYFRSMNKRRCFFVSYKNDEGGTYHASSQTNNKRVTYISQLFDAQNVEFADFEVKQISWERRPQGLDAMLADEHYMSAKSHFLKFE